MNADSTVRVNGQLTLFAFTLVAGLGMFFAFGMPAHAAAATWYVDAAAPVGGDGTATSTATTTIAAAVAAASSGDTIDIAADMYTEQVTINKSLTLVGAGAGSTFVKAPASLPSEGAIVDVDGSGVHADISQMTVEGPGPSSCGSIMSGVFVSGGADVSIHDITVNNIQDAPFSGCQNGRDILVGWGHGFGIPNTAGTATIKNVTTTNYQKAGIEVSGVGSSADIENNTVTGVGPTPAIAANGIEVTYGAAATVKGNTVTANSYTGANFAAGILLYQPDASTVVGANTVSGNQMGLWTNGQSSLGSISISGVSGNTRNAAADTTGWTAPSSAIVNPSLTGTSDANGKDLVASGGSVYVFGYNTFSTIQTALNALASGGTLTVAPGSYSESPTIAQPTTLQAQTYDDSATSTITGLVSINSDNVVVKGFELTNPTGSYVVSISGKSNVTVENNTIHDVGTSGAVSNVHAVEFQMGSGGGASNLAVSHNSIYNLGNVGDTGSVSAISVLDSLGAYNLAGFTADHNVISNVTASSTKKGAYGILLNLGSHAATAAVTGASITNNTISGLSGAWAHAIGLETDTPSASVTNNTIVNLTSSDSEAVHFELNPSASTVALAGDTFNGTALSNSTGTVTVNASIPTISEPHTYPEMLNGSTYNYVGLNLFPTIQAGVTNVQSGGTVSVASGAYNESVLINKILTITGSGATKPVIAGTSTADYILKIDGVANRVTVDGLEINGGGSTRGDNSLDYGVWVNNSGTSGTPVELKNLTVKNIWQNSANGIEVDASAVGGSYALIHDSGISSFDKRGIRFINSSGKVYNNQITGDHVDGTTRVQNLINLWGGSTVEVSGNTLHDGMSTTAGTWDSPAVFVSSYGGGADSHANIHDNTIYNVDTAVTVGSFYATTDNSTADIENNNIHDTHWGINFEKGSASATILHNQFARVVLGVGANDGNGGPLPLPVMNAAQNYWNSATGPTTASNSNVGTGVAVATTTLYRPWCIDSACTAVDTTPVSLASAAVNPLFAKLGTTVTVTLTFNKGMNTALSPTVGLTGIANATTTVTQSSFSGSTWIGTAVVATSTHAEFPVNVAVYGGEDAYGNQFPGTQSAVVLSVDTLAPAITAIDALQVGSNPSWLKIGDQIQFTVNTAKAEPDATVSGSYEGHTLTFVPNLSNTQFTGTYTVQSGDADQTLPMQLTGVTVTDQAGNISFAGSSTTITKGIDANAPTVTLPSTVYASTTAAIGATASDSGSGLNTYAWTWSGGPGSVNFSDATTLNPTVTATADGAYTLQLVVTDSAGNATTKTTTFYWDTTPPVVAVHADVSSNEATSHAGALVTFTNPTATDATDGTDPVICSPASGSVFAFGTTTVTCTAIDHAGNTGSSHFSIGVVDTTPPTITLTGGAVDMAINNTYVDPGYTATDTYDGTDSVTVTGTVDTSTAGVYTLHYDAVDAAGNHATQKTRSVTVEGAAFTLATSTVSGNIQGTLVTGFNASTTSNGTTVTFSVPSNTTVTGTSTWNGIVNFPTVTTTYTSPTPDSGTTVSVTSAIEIGSASSPLIFNKGVRILFAGKSGSRVGWSQNGTFTEITNVCGADSQAVGDALPASGDCKINSGSDLVVWTKHFTTFITYTQTAIPVPVSSGGGGGGGPIGIFGVINGSATQAPTTSSGQVLGASAYNFTVNFGFGASGADVMALQTLLTQLGFYKGPINGHFGPLTEAAVKAFQKANNLPQSGYVGSLTRADLNKGNVPAASESSKSGSGLTTSQIQSLVTLLQSFGVDAATIAKVTASLQ